MGDVPNYDLGVDRMDWQTCFDLRHLGRRTAGTHSERHLPRSHGTGLSVCWAPSRGERERQERDKRQSSSESMHEDLH